MARPIKTRDRIVEVARGLFNEQGYGAVSTAALAEACGIAEGNLWYHYKTRRALLDAIGERFALAIEARLALRPASDPVGDYAAMVSAMMAEFRDFRFLYRDQQTRRQWAPRPETLARERTVTVLGAGALGGISTRGVASCSGCGRATLGSRTFGLP